LHRSHFRPIPHRHLGTLQIECSGARLTDNPPRIERAAPDLGEHTASVLKDVLGMTADEVRRLVDLGVLR
jgi:crotonobetainyl-CoA:carnitine CoA-transferase CaiB-like acyl-CoA transferase